MEISKLILIYLEFRKYFTSVFNCLPSCGLLCSKKHSGNYFKDSVRDNKINFWAGVSTCNFH